MPDKVEVAGQGESRRIRLTERERRVCRQLAAGAVHQRQRALALMALDQGVTQAEASELSGLTIRQVRYWRDKFRQQRLGMFSENPPNGPSADSGPVSAEDRRQRDSQRETAPGGGQPKAAPNQGAKKKNSAAPKGADKTPKKAKRVKRKTKNEKKKAAKKKQSKKKKQKKKDRTEVKSRKKAKKPGRDKKQTKTKDEKPKKGKKAKAKKK